MTPSIRYLFYSEFFSFHPFFGIYEMKFAPRDCLVFRVSHFNLLGKFSGPVYHSSNCSEKSDSTSYQGLTSEVFLKLLLKEISHF
ncbi:hypothetical protein B1J93_00310 [Leptospira kirschneri serovar Pomona]|uniref:Uncharacterized protein n=1 Tax=Leptospira kirschneri serovar Pomona TaxID=561005 RepID=A0A1T1E5B2_9LEPT|nr:hypothetical protein LEP1GSC065_3524 [Leptospira kirschneri serovar Sokoine str. RM1]KPZ76316.1 hypothetical protein APS47_16460 [Leptospira kirschneri serovar Mozdok]OOV48143.1 hypothetical protein B1J93_00310 [Leptospira kirschneri serovar Pomona]